MDAEVTIDSEKMFETEKRILQELAAQTSCVIAGRSGFMVFRQWPNHLNIFIQASIDHRIKRIMSRRNATLEQAREIIEKMDATREAYIKKYEDTTRYDTRNYDLVISMDDLSEEDAAELIIDYINRTNK
jgi:cytidylate kinase